ncbi:MAG TPA: hypothetical protein VFZ25_15315 [Chloroflexota bacterium]|nr:hypothetical protein [Chloroflexota bacterium]
MFGAMFGRLFYVLLGVILGVVALFAYGSSNGLPAFLPQVKTAGVTTKGSAPAEFSGATLVKVLPVNLEAKQASVVVRVNSLEEYSDGFSLTYSMLSGQPGEPAPVLQPDHVAVTDDQGTVYTLSPMGSSTTVGPGLSSGYLTFSPALNPAAKTLTVTVPHALSVGKVTENGSPTVVDGPWTVTVNLK